jgi:ElaB/YqjD/DUF883 family membrane-anchored ribosome-binding protein
VLPRSISRIDRHQVEAAGTAAGASAAFAESPWLIWIKDGVVTPGQAASSGPSGCVFGRPRESVMPAGDPVVTRELKALQDDVSTSQRRRRSRREAHPAANAAAPPPEAVSAKPQDEADSADAQKLGDELRELLHEAAGVFDEAEKNVAAHPTASVLSALLVGILIGRLTARR